MNAEQALTQVAESIKNRPPSDTGKWYLTFIDGSFRLQPTRTEPTVWPVIATLSEYHIEQGLTNSSWTTIKNRVAKLIMIGAQI